MHSHYLVHVVDAAVRVAPGREYAVQLADQEISPTSISAASVTLPTCLPNSLGMHSCEFSMDHSVIGVAYFVQWVLLLHALH